MKPFLFLAADDLSYDVAHGIVKAIGDRISAIKIHELVDRLGPSVIKDFRTLGVPVWVDAKLHDIPKTVGLRTAALAENGAAIITVHASGGVEMMRAAVENAHGAKIYAVTVLTSLSEGEVQTIYGATPATAVITLAHMAKHAGVHGVVCSPQEVKMLASDPALSGLEFIVPGVRSPGKDVHDQKRVGTPAQAVKDGATGLVVGRQITQAKNFAMALQDLEAELGVT